MNQSGMASRLWPQDAAWRASDPGTSRSTSESRAELLATCLGNQPGWAPAASRALHTIAVARLRDDPQTRAYAARRVQGKSARDIRRCVKRAIARQLFKLLERCIPDGVEVLTPA